MANDVKSLPSPTLSEAMQLYLQLKGVGNAKTFHQAAMRNVGVVIDIVGDKPLALFEVDLVLKAIQAALLMSS